MYKRYLDSCCEKIEEQVKNLRQYIGYLSDTNDKLIKGIYEKEELKELKEEVQLLREMTPFTINDAERKKINEWTHEHVKKVHHVDLDNPPVRKYVGYSFSYEFTPTELGMFGDVKCTCGKSFTFKEAK